MNTPYTKWNREEIEHLVITYPNLPLADLVKMFPRHTAKAISTKAAYLGIKKSKAYISLTRKEGNLKVVQRNGRDKRVLVTALKSVYDLVKLGEPDMALQVINRVLSEQKGE